MHHSTPQNILIVEDWKALARALKAILTAAGHSVTWITGAEAINCADNGSNVIVGLGENGTKIALDLSDFQVAFVDGQVEGDIQGPAMVRNLCQHQIACCAMSTSSSLNEEMLEAGARLAAKKPVVFAALLSEQINTDRILRPTHSDAKRLAALEGRFAKIDCQDLREQAEAYLAPFLKADH